MRLAELAAACLQLSEDACISKIKQARWPDGFRCPRCTSGNHYEISGRRLPLYECANCRFQCSLTAGTVMERSRLPLRKWLAAIALAAENGISAVRLAESIQVTYKTAWLVLHKLRHAMACHNERDLLTGLVRLDTAVYGWRKLFLGNGLYPSEHPFIIGASVADGRIAKVVLLQDRGGDTYYWKPTPQGAAKIVERYVDPSANVEGSRTDNRPLMLRLSLRSIGWEACSRINWVHVGIGAKHLQWYLHEQAYRYNRKQTAPDSAGRLLLELACSMGAPTMKSITGRALPGRSLWKPEENPRRYATARFGYPIPSIRFATAG